MEASSPLAAMQPPAYLPHHGFDRGFPSMRLPTSYVSSDFNFRDLSMKMAMRSQSQQDYFSWRPAQSSSPTAELVADFSQNFTVEQSPIVPTPRRALFVNNMFAPRTTVNATTPPVPSSSPGVQDIDMDLSPLPHKSTHFQVTLQSPTPDMTPEEASTCFFPPPVPEDRPDSAPPTMIPEKRKPPLLRPSLARAKTLSASLTEQQRPVLPAFRFGSYPDTRPVNASSLSLEQIFEESSPGQDRSSPVNNFQVPRPRVLFDSTNVRNGSPLSHARKVSNQTNPTRPRKQFRRAQSMYQTADEVMKQDVLPPMPSSIVTDTAYIPRLPTVDREEQANDLPRISKETMIDILDGKYDTCYSSRAIIDCRFEYEFNGGHIKGARNYNDKETLAAQLFDVEPSLQSMDPTKPALIILHCEYSAHRAPLVAKHVRNKDRAVNMERYPALTYPEMYILDGGYSSFFKDYRSRCDPESYVEMDAKEHVAACERGMGKVKHAQRTKLMRAQTFAFGQHSTQLDSSPTAMSRCRTDDSMDMDLCLDYTPARPEIRRHNFRMLSYPG